MSWSEDSLHRWLATRRKPKGLVGSQGHDAAVLAARPGRSVLCTDACVEGVHYARGESAARVGAKAAARSLSDLAACGAEPQALLLALRAPLETKESHLRALITGVANLGERFGAPLVGGDLTCAPGPISLTVCAQGFLAGSAKPVARDRARVGQVVLLTGPVGGSRMGRHLEFEPRIQAGRALAGAGATVLMDVSDGLALDLARIARASKVGIRLDTIPVHRDALRLERRDGMGSLEHALFDGEDHELIACLAPNLWKRAASRLLAQIPDLVVIGQVIKGTGLHLNPDLPVRLPADRTRWGWIHGGAE